VCPRGSSRAAVSVPSVPHRHPSPLRTLRPFAVRPPPPLFSIIAVMHVPTAMPRLSAAAPASACAILTRLPRSNRRLAAVSSRALSASAAAAAAAAGPSPCRSCAVALLPPRLTCVAGGAVSHRLVLSPASSRLALLLPPPACKFASACKLQGVFCVVDCPPSSCVAATPSACAALPTLPDSRSPRCCCSRASRRCRRLPLSSSRGVSASSSSLLCTGAPA